MHGGASKILEWAEQCPSNFYGLSHAMHFHCSGTWPKQSAAAHQIASFIRGCGGLAVFLMERTHTHTSEQCLLCGKEPRVTSVNETVLLQHVTQLSGVDLACQ